MRSLGLKPVESMTIFHVSAMEEVDLGSSTSFSHQDKARLT